MLCSRTIVNMKFGGLVIRVDVFLYMVRIESAILTKYKIKSAIFTNHQIFAEKANGTFINVKCLCLISNFGLFALATL